MTVSRIEARSTSKSEEPSDIQRQRNVTELIFFFALYNIKLTSGFHKFLENVIWSHMKEVYNIYGDTIANGAAGLEKKVVNFLELSVAFAKLLQREIHE